MEKHGFRKNEKFSIKKIFEIIDGANAALKLMGTNDQIYIYPTFRELNDIEFNFTQDISYVNNYFLDLDTFRETVEEELSELAYAEIITLKFERVETANYLYARSEKREYFIEFYRR